MKLNFVLFIITIQKSTTKSRDKQIAKWNDIDRRIEEAKVKNSLI